MDEYSAGGGGKLKLKGAKVSDGRVKKKKSSKKSSSAATAAGAGGAEKEREKSSEAAAAAAGEEGSSTTAGALLGEEGEEGDGSSTPQSQSQSHAPAKTEAEKRHEEMRKKRVCCTDSTLLSPSRISFRFFLDVLLFNVFYFCFYCFHILFLRLFLVRLCLDCSPIFNFPEMATYIHADTPIGIRATEARGHQDP